MKTKYTWTIVTHVHAFGPLTHNVKYEITNITIFIVRRFRR